MSLNEVHTLMAVNCYPIALLTKQVLKSFKSRFNKDNKIRSLIINFSAGASLIPTPFVQLYSATKVYTDFLSEGLAYELKELNCDVMTVRSYNLTNEIDFNNEKIPFFVRLATVTPEQCVKASLNKFTVSSHFGAFPHEFLGTMLTCVIDLMPFEFSLLMTGAMGKKIKDG